MKIHADALLFDNDGTLVSSLDSVDRCWTRWAREYGITAEDVRAGRAARPPGRRDSRRPAARRRRAGGPRADRDSWRSRTYPAACVLLPGTKDFLDSLPADRWAVVTSATRRLAEARLDERRHPAQDADRRRRHHARQARPRALPARRPRSWASTRRAASSSRTPRPGCGRSRRRHDHRGVDHNPPGARARRRRRRDGPVGRVRAGHRRGSGDLRTRLTVRLSAAVRYPDSGGSVRTVRLLY